MGRKLDLSGLTDGEAEHVLKVVQRDMKLRKKEEDRLSEMKQELAEEGSRCSILSKQHRFNEHCCIRCCAPFTFLLNPKRQCPDCQYNVCKTCCTYSKRDKAWLCSACQKGRILKTQSLEWYYNNVKSRFKRFGSAKVLKTLYRKHIIERGTFSDLPESSVHEGSNDNDGSVCGSDSAFYKQSEGHSMAETLTVALRVAEEAIEEAIAKAEEFSDSLEKQNEARYLRDHKEELIEELATTIVQKIIQRRKRSEMQTEYDFVWPQSQSLIQPSELPSPSQPHTSSQGPQDPLKTSYSLYRLRSAFSLTSDDSPEKGPEEEVAEAGGGNDGLQEYASLKREPKAATSLPTWKSMDRLDNSSASSVLQSPDGNWIALHSSQLSRPSLLTKRKSLLFSVLEKESGVVSAYDEMGSDSEEDDEGGWGAALRQFRRKLSDETYYTDSQHDPEWIYTQHLPVTSPSSGQYTNTETLNSDSEASSVLSACPRKSPHNLMRKKGPPDTHLHPHHQPLHHQHLQQNFSPYPVQSESLDVNFNPKVMGDSSEAEERQSDPVRRSRRRRKSKRESSSEQNRTGGQSHPQSVYPLAQENSGILLHALLKRGLSEEQPKSDTISVATAAPDAFKLDAMTTEPEDLDTLAPNSPVPSPSQPPSLTLGRELSSSSSGPGSTTRDPLEGELQSRLGQLVISANSKDSSSSEEECTNWPADRQTDKESDRQREKLKPKERERERQRVSDKSRERASEAVEQVNGQEIKRSEKLIKSPSVREDGRSRERRFEKACESLDMKVEDQEQKRGDKREPNRQSKRQHKRDAEKEAGPKVGARSGSSASSPAVTPSSHEGALSNNQVGQNDLEQLQRLQLLSSVLQQKCSAASLCSITTEVLKVLNATEDLIGEAGGESYTPSESMSASPISSSSETRRLDQRLTKMEENVYLAAGAVYGLEGALGDLEHCARSISSGTTDQELAFLEDQVATAAAQVQQSELQISNIEARISALKTAGLNVTVCNRFSKLKPKSKPQTLDSSRHQRRKLPAPPLKEKLEPEQQVKVFRP
ncbi:rab effector MyRIP isoform X1 [Simochromis diagramma]|uniref:rab effector MyRIP isoform X1 n=1 Tax=Simochromis diagramma TaxID=43689 RepID=UPI001A7EEFC2|nr:rab effector MyRIP isoform X1 [Simochromis diagramma]XP_039900049.1 rab effector MyRIP isoform X1 [Simochromis diagramma]